MKNLLCLNALSRTSHLHRGYDLHAGHQYVFNAEAPKQDLVAAIKEKEKSVQDKKEKPEDKAKDIVDEAKTDSLIKAEEDKIQKLAIDPKQKEALQGKFNELKDKRVAEVKKVGDMKEDDLKKVVEDTNKAITEFEKQDGVKGLMDLVEKRDAVLDAVRIRTYKRGDWENMNQRLFKSGIAKDREEIKAIQKLLKIAQDGKVGPETTNALSAFYGIQLGTQIGSETTDEHGNKIDATAKAVTGAEAATAGEAPVAPVTPGGPGAEAVPGAPGAAPADAGKVGPDGKPIDPRVDLPKVKLDGFGQNREIQDPTQDVLNGFSDAKKQQMLNDIAGGKMEITPLQSARIKQVDLLDKAFQSVLTDAKESRTWSEGLQQTWTEASGTTNLRILNLSNDIARAMTELRDKTIKDPDFKPGPGLPANLRSMLVRKFGGDAGTLIGANNGPDSLPAMQIALLNCLRSNRDYGSAERLVQDNILKDEFDAERKKFEPTADEKKEIAKSEKKTREGILSQREVILQGKKNDAYKVVEADLYASIRKENPTISDADVKKQVDGKKDEILAKIDNPENTTRWNSEIDTYTNDVVAYNKEEMTNRLIGRHNDGKPFPGLTGAKAEAMEKYSDMMGNGGAFDWADSTQDTILDELIVNAPLILCSGFAASAVRGALTAGARGLLLSGRFANVGLKVARVASISESGMALDAAGNVLGKAAEAGKALRMTGSGMGLGVEAAEGTYIVQGTGKLANAALKAGKIGGLAVEGATFETVNAAMQGQWIGNDEHYVKRIFWSAATLGTFHATGEVASKLTNSISKIANLAPKSVLGRTLQLGVSYPLEVMTMMAVDVARNGYEHGTIDAPTRDELIHALISVGALKMAGGALSFAGKKFMPDKGPGPEGPKIEGGKPEGAGESTGLERNVTTDAKDATFRNYSEVNALDAAGKPQKGWYILESYRGDNGGKTSGEPTFTIARFKNGNPNEGPEPGSIRNGVTKAELLSWRKAAEAVAQPGTEIATAKPAAGTDIQLAVAREAAILTLEKNPTPESARAAIDITVKDMEASGEKGPGKLEALSGWLKGLKDLPLVSHVLRLIAYLRGLLRSGKKNLDPETAARSQMIIEKLNRHGAEGHRIASVIASLTLGVSPAEAVTRAEQGATVEASVVDTTVADKKIAYEKNTNGKTVDGKVPEKTSRPAGKPLEKGGLTSPETFSNVSIEQISGLISKLDATRDPAKKVQMAAEILGLDPENFTEAEFKKAYRALANQYHPDKTKNADPADKPKMEEAFKLVSSLKAALDAHLAYERAAAEREAAVEPEKAGKHEGKTNEYPIQRASEVDVRHVVQNLHLPEKASLLLTHEIQSIQDPLLQARLIAVVREASDPSLKTSPVFQKWAKARQSVETAHPQLALAVDAVVKEGGLAKIESVIRDIPKPREMSEGKFSQLMSRIGEGLKNLSSAILEHVWRALLNLRNAFGSKNPADIQKANIELATVVDTIRSEHPQLAADLTELAKETGSPIESSIKVPEVKSTIGLAYDVLERAMDNGELKGLGDIAFRVTNTLRDFPSTEKVKPEDIMDLHMLADKLPPTATKLAADLRELARQASPGEELIQAAHRELEQLQKNGGLDRVRNNIKSGTDVSIIRSDGSRQVCKAIYLSDVGLTTRVTWTEVVNGKEVSIYKDVQTSDLLKWTDAMGKSEKSPVGPGFKKAEQAAYRELDASKKGESPIKNELRLSIRGTLDGLEALRSKGDTVGLEKAGVELSKAADQLPPTATKLAASLRKLAANLSPKS